GKTMVYFLPLILWPHTYILIITLLKVLGNEQVEKLASVGIRRVLSSCIRFTRALCEYEAEFNLGPSGLEIPVDRGGCG
ncbi:hypothetical protein BCR41DRAFT_313331, partial [Lobosporangium transversale]